MTAAPNARYALDPARTRITIRTRTEGLFSPLAHALEIEARPSEGGGEDVGATWSAHVIVPTRELKVAGVVRHGKVDAGVLSASDRAEIERKIRDEVLGFAREIRVDASGAAGAGEVTIAGARGAIARSRVTWERLAGVSSDVMVQGECEVSLAALGAAPVKGPLGAFRVSDRVQVRFRAAWVLKP